MISRFSILNFRGFERLEMEKFARVNLIAGRNNAGKTALLEALYLHLSPTRPQSATSFSHRGESRGSITLPAFMSYADEWKTLFYALDPGREILLGSTTSDGVNHQLAVTLREAAIEFIEPPSRGPQGPTGATGPMSPEPTVELVYRYEDSSGITSEAVATPSSVGSPGLPRERLRIERHGEQRHPNLKPATFLSTDPQSRSQIAEQFSRLRSRKAASPVEEVVRMLDPRVRSLEILVEERRPELAAHIDLGQFMPLRMMGEGVSRVVEILLAVFKSTGTIVLIDEIENGLHYSVMQEVWSAIMSAARRADAQVFATTHSFECIRAAHRAAGADPTYDFLVHRLDRVDGQVISTTLDFENLQTASAMGIEVR